MEANNISIPAIDIVRLKNEVREKAKEYLDEINEQNLEDFANSTKLIAETILERYYYDVFDCYTKGALTIDDPDKLSTFKDLESGYLICMRQWIQAHQIQIDKMNINSDIKVPEMKELKINPKTVVVSGTTIASGLTVAAIIKAYLASKAANAAIATGVVVSSSIWAGVAAKLLIFALIVEGLSLGTAYYLKQKEIKYKEDYRVQIEFYKTQIEAEKVRLVNGLIGDLCNWLESAKVHSESILQLLNLQTI